MALIGRDNISRAILRLEKSCRAVHQHATPAMCLGGPCERNKSGFVGVNLFYALKDSVLIGIQALFSNFRYCRSSLQMRLSQQTSPQ
jgi:hypothetical protein